MKKQTGKRRSPVPSSAMLDEMIEEATVDAYGSSEPLTGFYTMLDEHLVVPLAATPTCGNPRLSVVLHLRGPTLAQERYHQRQ